MIFSRFKELDQPPGYYDEWVGRVQSVHGALFTYIEALIVLAALQFGAQQSGSWLLWGVLAVAFVFHLSLTGMYVRAGVMRLVHRLGLKGSWRQFALTVAYGLGFFINFGLLYVLDNLIDQMISAGLAG